MRALVVSDLHGEEAALEKVVARAKDYDHVLVAGDMGGGQGFAKEIAALGNVFAVPGNGDGEFLERIFGGRFVHARRVGLEEGLNLVGFGYSPPTPFHTPLEFPEDKLYGWMKGLPIDGDTIFMTHAPPYGIMDEVRGGHAGSAAVKRVIGEKRPLLNVCGHIHEREGVGKLGNTSVLKVGAAKLGRCGTIEIKKGKLELGNMEL
ncbi:MAG: metallophosphoesterase family protein [Candidatus ainarchaeum sp.]|nr:metallophosphoesterase family protein [Candidatus ainarchaeum sp.]